MPKTQTKTKQEVDRASRCGDIVTWNVRDAWSVIGRQIYVGL